MKRPSPGLKTAVESLRAEEQRLEGELAALKLSEKELAAELRRVKAGIHALTGEPSQGGDARASLTDSQAADLLAEALQQGRPMTIDALKARLMEHVKANDLSGTGVHLVLKRVLKGDRFKETAEGFTLKAMSKERHA